MSEKLINALLDAVAAVPDDIPLRLRLGRLLIDAGRPAEALDQIDAVLRLEPAHHEALDLLARADQQEAQPGSDLDGGFDFRKAEQELGDIVGPRFVNATNDPTVAEGYVAEVERVAITLDDVGGMQTAKDRLNAAFLAPLKNPELRKLYGKSLGGGLLLYGPPGCGKTFLARAVAGELGASFISVGLTDILDPYLGLSERRMKQVFELARSSAPCVLFFDELDAIGMRRSKTSESMRGVVNQLLTELDGFDGPSEGVFVLGATNQPWDLDPALRRPPRFDRTVVVLPPDAEARRAIFTYHLARRPIENVDLAVLVKRSERFSGADIAHVCEVASEIALLDSARTGVIRMINQTDLETALTQVRPSTMAWLETARNIVMFGEDDGTFEELRSYLKSVGKL